MNTLLRLNLFYPSILPSWNDTTGKAKKLTFSWASYFTDPVCNFDADKMYLNNRVFEQLFPSNGSIESRASNMIRKSVITIDMIRNLVLTPFTAPIGIALRFLGTNLSKEPFIYETTDVFPKILPEDESFSLVNWNVLLIAGGRSILCGGAPHANSPYSSTQGLPYLGLEWIRSFFFSSEDYTTRLDAIIEQLKKEDADVVCLYEGFDFSAAEKIRNALRNQYHCMISNIAPVSLGTNSGVMIFSKFIIPRDSLDVMPFPKKYVVYDSGKFSIRESAFCEKSIVGFTIVSVLNGKEKRIADIFAEHLQHSKRPDPKYVTQEEKSIREDQLHILLNRVEAKKSQAKKEKSAIIVCGDLNLDPNELKAHPRIVLNDDPSKNSAIHFIEKGGSDPTWGGDASCAPLDEIDHSGPQKLDYVLAVKDTVNLIKTEMENIGEFNENTIQWGPLSDHQLIRSYFKLMK